MPRTETAGWERVADAVNARMDELGWEQVDLARRAEVSDATVRKLQRAAATRYQRATLTRVSRALGWPADGIFTILAGGDPPEPLPPVEGDASDERVEDELLEHLAEIRAAVADLEARLERRRTRR